MEFEFTPDQRRFRQEFCQYLRAEMSPDVRRRSADHADYAGYTREFVLEFRKRVGQRGYMGIGWPREVGGGGKDMLYQVILHEELEYHDAPHLTGTYRYIPPSLLLFGTEEQKRFFLPKIQAGEIDFFVGYSEPEAGSDLANLQCRAVLEGDEFVVNGQKLFSSQANLADYGWMAVRTDPTVPKHKGVSLLIVDMKSPGVTIDTYMTMGGWWHHGVHFDNVRVPRSMLVGELNRGWYHLMAALDFERAANGNPGHATRLFDQLLTFCREERRNGRILSEEPSVRNLLADLAADVRASWLVAYWVASMHARGLHPQHEATLVTLMTRETARRISVAHMELLGPCAQLRRGSPWASQDGVPEFQYRNDMFFHFAAGGFDITRNVIAGRGLALPRG